MPALRNKKTWTFADDGYARALCVVGSYLYVGINESPAKVLKVDRSTGSISDSWTGSANENNCYSLDWDGSYLYVALGTASGDGSCVVKLDVSDMSEVDQWVHPTAGKAARSVHCFGSYIYVGDNVATNSNVFKIDPSDMTTDDTWTSVDNVITIYALENDGTYLYAGGQGSIPAKVAKIDVSDMSKSALWTGDAGDPYEEQKVDCLVWDGTNLFAGLDTAWANAKTITRVVKIDTSDMSTVTRWMPTDNSYDYAFSGLYYSPYLYFGIESGAGMGAVRLSPSDLSLVDNVALTPLSQNAISNSGATIYLGANVTPARVYVLGETTGPFPTHFVT